MKSSMELIWNWLRDYASQISGYPVKSFKLISKLFSEVSKYTDWHKYISKCSFVIGFLYKRYILYAVCTLRGH